MMTSSAASFFKLNSTSTAMETGLSDFRFAS